MSPLKVIHVYESLHPKHGGPPEVVVHLAKEQIKQGLNISFISCDPLNDLEVNQYLKQSLGFEPIRHCVQPKWFRAIFSRLNLVSLIKTADIVHIHGVWPVLSLVVAHLCINHQIPYLISLHGSLRVATLKHRSWKKQLGLKQLGYGEILSNARYLQALNPSEAQEAKLLLDWIDPQKVGVLGNGVGTCVYDDQELKHGFELYYPTLRPREYLLFLSRLHPRKNPMLLLEAFGALHSKYPHLKLVFAGESEEGCLSLLDQIITRLEERSPQIRSQILMIGFVSGLKKWSILSQAKSFILPSLSEGFSIAVLESLSVGVPTIISTECHFNELIDEKAGLVHRLDRDDLIDKIDQVLGDQDLEEELRVNSQKLIRRAYSWAKISASMISIYESICNCDLNQ